MVDFVSSPIPFVPYCPVTGTGSAIVMMSFQGLAERVPRERLATPHRLGFHKILLVEEGTATFSIDSARIEGRPGSLLWVRPNQVVQTVLHPGVKGDMIMFTEVYPLGISTAAGSLHDLLSPSCWQLQDTEHARLGRVFGLLREELGRPEGQIDEPVLKHLLAVVVLTIHRICEPRREDRRYPEEHVWAELVLRFRQELDRSYRTTRRVEDYAATLNCGTRALSRACQAVFGTSAKDVIDSRVALEARRLLAHTHLSIGAVARHLGFTEVTNFNKFFIRRVNMTPGAFRRTHGVDSLEGWPQGEQGDTGR